uniref:Uncharacterized protein n=1 Tax=Panagrolaimus sp. ES5 TaxID=591445 RepID=A0AC34F9W0_9BILA
MAPRKTKRDTSESVEEETTPPPKKVKKASRKDNDNEESDSEQQSTTKIPNINFIELIHDLNEYAKEKLHKLKGKPDVVRIVESIPMFNKYHDLISQPNFMSDFNALYITAARRKNIYLDDVVHVIDRYLNDGATVEDFPGFPKAPSR